MVRVYVISTDNSECVPKFRFAFVLILVFLGFFMDAKPVHLEEMTTGGLIFFDELKG